MPVSAADSPQALVCCNHTPCFPKLLQRGLTCQHKQAIVTVVQQAMVTMLLQLATLLFICYCFTFMYCCTLHTDTLQIAS